MGHYSQSVHILSQVVSYFTETAEQYGNIKNQKKQF